VADYTPVYSGGVKPLTFTTSGAVTGGQVLVASAAGTVAASGAASAVAVGVAAHDAASGGRVTVWPLANVVHEIVTTGTVTALDGVTSATAGTVATVVVATGAAAGTLIGIALTTATTGLKVRFIGRG
jgi:hypothetical protein